jgi:hypothetical protein
MKKSTLIGAIIAALPLLAIAVTVESVAYPEGYRSWTHVKSMVIHPDHDLADPFEGIHHVYANDAALAGLESNSYQKGATIVFDLLSQNVGGGATQEGDRKFIGVMEYDPERFAATGGWGFEVFPGNSTTERGVKDGGTSCYACHQAAKANSYVFSKYRK